MTITVRRRAQGSAQINVVAGVSGLSAYQIAVKNGFEGTEQEWLASLVGGGGTAAFVHSQPTPSNLWNVNHNLGVRPIVSLQTTGGVEFEGTIVHLSSNQFQVQLSSPQSGFARCI